MKTFKKIKDYIYTKLIFGGVIVGFLLLTIGIVLDQKSKYEINANSIKRDTLMHYYPTQIAYWTRDSIEYKVQAMEVVVLQDGTQVATDLYIHVLPSKSKLHIFLDRFNGKFYEGTVNSKDSIKVKIVYYPAHEMFHLISDELNFKVGHGVPCLK
jgi:hypothetical protein